MSLRLKIQTVPPNLPALRVWFVPTGVPPSSSSALCFDPSSSSSSTHQSTQPTQPFTVHTLKTALCTQLPEFKDLGAKPRELGLYVDEFEIMDGTEVRGVVRDGDVVCVRRKVASSPSEARNEKKEGKKVEEKGKEKEKSKKGKDVKEEERSEGRGTKRKRAASDAAASAKIARSTGVKGKEKAKDKVKEKGQEKDKGKGKGKVKGINLRKTTKRADADSDSDTDSSSSSSSSASSSSSSSSKSSSSSGFSSSSASSSSSSSSASSVSSSSSSSSSDSESDNEGRKDAETPVPLKIRKTSTESKVPKGETAPPTMTIAIRPNARPQHPTPSVPPGMGKPTTHARNERRRKRRVAEKNALALGTSFAGSSAANAVPLGFGGRVKMKKDTEDADADVDLDAEGDTDSEEGEGEKYGGVGGDERQESQEDRIVMASLRNKNKKKGFFKQGMMRGLEGGRAKIVFGEDGGEARDAMDVDGGAGVDMGMAVGLEGGGVEGEGEQRTKAPTNHHRDRARLVPPSELQDLGKVPKNLFVTSVDVEEGMWGEGSGSGRKRTRDVNGASTKGVGSENKKSQRKNGKKGKAKAYEGEYWDDGWDGAEHGRFDDAEEEIVLDYGEGDNGGGGGYGQEKPNAPVVDWDKAEVGWNNFAVVSEKGQVEVGGVVGWKSLGLNPATLTPEVMLSLARVASKEDDALTIRHIDRPDPHEAAFSFGIAKAADLAQGEGDGDREEEGEEEVVSWDAVFALGEGDKWRVVGFA